MSYSAVGDLFYNIIDKNDIVVAGGGVTQAGGKTINTLEEYNQSVLGPMQVPAGGRVVTFKTQAEQTAFTNSMRSRMPGVLEQFFKPSQSQQPSQLGMPLTTKLLIGAGAIAAIWFMVKR